MVFENSPVSIWEEDFSDVKIFLDSLKKEGITDIETYFEQHPEVVRQCASLVKIVDANRAAILLQDATSKEELKAGLINTFTPESFKTFRQEMIGLWNGETEMASDAVVKTFMGNVRNVTVYFSVPPGYESMLSRAIVSLIDITERKKSERQPALLSFALSHVHEAFSLIDKNARFLYANNVFCQMLGFNIKELLGMSIEDVAPEWTVERWRQFWFELRNKGSVVIKSIFSRKNGVMLTAEADFNCFEYEGKNYAIVLVRDIA